MTNNQITKQILFLDGLRGLAALHVCIGHIRVFVWEGYTSGYKLHSETYSMLDKMMMYFFSMFRYGHEMVLFFFVLSGFVIHLKYVALFQQNVTKPDYKDFLLKRVKRIYPALLSAMFITFILDKLGIFLKLPIYFETAYPMVNFMVRYNHSWQTLLGNIVFLEDIAFDRWGTNSPVWSLVLEWWFYMVYPLFWFIMRKSILPATAIVVTLYIVFRSVEMPSNIITNLGRSIFLSLPLWWSGILLAEVYSQRIKINLLWLSPLLVCFPIALLFPTEFSNFTTLIVDFAWDFGFLGLLAIMLHLANKGFKFHYLEKLSPLGDMSYSLYIVHYPIAVFIGGLVMILQPDNKLPQHSWFILISLFIIMPICYYVHIFIEKPFIKHRTKS